MRVIGMISGTSHDGIDVAIVDFAAKDGLVVARIEHTSSVPYSDALRGGIIAALPPGEVGFDEVCRLDTAIGEAFAAVAADAIARHGAAGGGPVDLICSHGQTLYHWVEHGRAFGTLQLGQPAWIGERTGLPVVSDVRAADVAAGGQGAPLVPILDRILLEPFRSAGRRAGSLNLGGISNLSVATPGSDELIAWDIGPANALIDAVVTAAPEVEGTFDRNGALAARGTVIAGLLDELCADPYYQALPPKSTGKEHFHLAYLRDVLGRMGLDALSTVDLVATLTELTAATVADAIQTADLEVVLGAGGGVRNPVLMRRIQQRCPAVDFHLTDEAGVPADEKEAVAFAIIGWATAHGLPSNVPSCTGASGPRVLGRVSPGLDGRLPDAQPIAVWPRLTFSAEQ